MGEVICPDNLFGGDHHNLSLKEANVCQVDLVRIPEVCTD